jgi:hypothetical protein
MGTIGTDIFSLQGGGKREYREVEGEVSRQEFEHYQLIDQVVFGDRGFVDTLGSTWSMVHDPRFTKIENTFIIRRKGVVGGDASEGIQRQQADGSFSTSEKDLAQYELILGHGRYMNRILKSERYDRAIKSLFPEQDFNVPAKHIMPGLAKYAKLTEEQRAKVDELAATYTDLQPGAFKDKSDLEIWRYIKREYSDYFFRNGEPNKLAQQLYKLFRADLLGLIDAYAEVAKIQEWVYLDDTGTLMDEADIQDPEVQGVWYELDLLEKALSFRASLRTVAARIVVNLGLDTQISKGDAQLTDIERDHLLRIIYASKWPDDKPQLLTNIMGFLTGIKLTGKTVEEREADQLSTAAIEAQDWIKALATGEAQIINRQTEPDLVDEASEEEKIAKQILHNPRKGDLWLRMKGMLDAIDKIDAACIVSEEGDPEEAEIVTRPLTDAERDVRAIYASAVDVLAPVFESSSFKVDNDAYDALVAKVDAILADLPQGEVTEVAGSNGALISTPMSAIKSGAPVVAVELD